MRKTAVKFLGLALALCMPKMLRTTDFSVKDNLILCNAEVVDKEKTGISLENHAKSAYLMDFETQTEVYSKEPNKRLPIASMCKIMTLILTFDAIREGHLTLEEEIQVSEKAASMGGSQVFLETNAKYKTSELIKSIIVCSANDSCVAIAERISGAENVFVERMNERAKELEATDTLFANCTGMPKEPQYSCAKDVALMLKELLTNETYYEYGKVWMDKFSHPEGRYTEITNTNKLIRFYDGCDGGKTGFTNEAGFCLAATAKRNDMRVISVVIGEENSNTRFQDVKTMFDYAFANYRMTPIIKKDIPLERKAKVDGGKVDEIEICAKESAFVFERKTEKNEITLEYRLKNVKAPIKKGDSVGEVLVFKNGIETDKVTLIANEDVKKANFFDRMEEIGKNWTKR